MQDWGFGDFVRASVAEGFLHEPVIMEGMSGAHIVQNGHAAINFSGINFLGWQQRPEIIGEFCEAAQRYGLSTGGSRATQGICEPHLRLEAMLSRHHGKERTLSFASGMLANIGFINAMTARFGFSPTSSIDNRNAVMVFDRDCHWSLWKAASHLEFGKQLFAFRHNDVEDLERVLGRLSGRKCVVVFESLYSSDGSVAPIGAVLDSCERHGALSYIDDANGFMVYGTAERPFHKEFSQLRRADFIMVSLSKSVGLEGGAISGRTDHIDAFEALSGTSIFTAALQPPTAELACSIITRLERDPDIIDAYLARAAHFRSSLASGGLRLNETPSYITSVLIGNESRAEDVRRRLEAGGYCAPIFRYPAVKPGQALIRLILHRDHTLDDIEGFRDLLCQQLGDGQADPTRLLDVA